MHHANRPIHRQRRLMAIPLLLLALCLAMLAVACTTPAPQQEAPPPAAAPETFALPAGSGSPAPKGLDFVFLDIDTSTASDCSTTEYPDAKRIDVVPQEVILHCDQGPVTGECHPKGRQVLWAVHNLSPNQRMQFAVKDSAGPNAAMFTPPDIPGGKAQACEHYDDAPWLCPAALSGVPKSPNFDEKEEARWEYRVLVRENGPNGTVVACADPIILVTMAGNE